MNKNNPNESSKVFKKDVLKGLTSSPKHLFSKYLYDKNGDKLFQKIMAAEQYYLTDAELEIFNTRCKEMLNIVSGFPHGFDLIELGAGDALKSTELLKCLSKAKKDFTYYPIDISANIIQLVERELPQKIEGINIHGIVGEYFTALQEAGTISEKPKLVLFLGGNIGNMPPDDAVKFGKELHNQLKKGDLVLMGFDLKKNPWTIFNAYNDKDGITRDFNLNLLKRINRELDGNFDLKQFDHYESYDPETGACNSYVFSLTSQKVSIADTEIQFHENEIIFMETSQKYSLQQTKELAKKCGFEPIMELFDSKKLFTDVVWRRM